MIYKVSYMVLHGEHPGAIANATKRPEVGDHVKLGDAELEIVEVLELMPPRGEFAFLHATCKLIKSEGG